VLNEKFCGSGVKKRVPQSKVFKCDTVLHDVLSAHHAGSSCSHDKRWKEEYMGLATTSIYHAKVSTTARTSEVLHFDTRDVMCSFAGRAGADAAASP
jgi:hypothetical protein